MATTHRILLLCALLLVGLGSSARAQQKIAYVDVSAIMKALPDAQDAQRQLDQLVDKWQRELEDMQREWQDRFNDYDKRKLILTDQGRANAEKELQDLEKRIFEFREKKFGQSGELFTKEDELMRPIQNVVFDQVKNLAVELGYDYVLDKSGGVMIIYAKDAHDLTTKAIDRIKKTLPPRAVPGQTGMPGQTGQPGQTGMPGQTGGQRPPDVRPDGTVTPVPEDQPK